MRPVGATVWTKTAAAAAAATREENPRDAFISTHETALTLTAVPKGAAFATYMAPSTTRRALSTPVSCLPLPSHGTPRSAQQPRGSLL